MSYNGEQDAKLDVTTYQRDRTSDNAWKADTCDLLIDVLCSRNVDPRNQKCAPRR